MKNKIKNRRQVEIYFVLYLAALIILLPKQKELLNSVDDQAQNVFSIPFSLKSEKPNLVCRLKRDSNRIHIATLDSTNVIYYEGDVRDVKFEFQIEDQLRKQSLNLDRYSQNISKFFQFEERSENKSAIFYWNPSEQDLVNNNYLVKVIATGKLNDPNGKSQTVISKTQFSLNMLFDNEDLVVLNDMILTSSDSLALADTNKMNEKLSISMLDRFLADPELIVQEPILNSLEHTEWTNTIYTFNLDPTTDLNGSPSINIVGANREIANETRIVGYSNNSITISGKTPEKKTIQVSIQLERKYDNSIASVEFQVRPLAFEEPDIPKFIYPDREYIFDPKLPMITGKQMSVRITQNGVVKYFDNQGAKFKFSASASDIQNPIIFERLVDGVLYGKKHEIPIKDYPPPDVRGILNEGKNKQIIRTTSYGEVNGQPNYVMELEIISGKATIREIYGNASSKKDEKIYYQEFEVSNNLKKPQTVTFKIVDKHGVKSKNYTLKFD